MPLTRGRYIATGKPLVIKDSPDTPRPHHLRAIDEKTASNPNVRVLAVLLCLRGGLSSRW